MKRTMELALALVLVLVTAGAVGCSKKAATTVTPPPAVEPARPTTPSTQAPSTSTQPATRVELDFRPAFFDYDKSGLRPDAVEALTHDAKLLGDDPSLRILIEGHCDERGTREYNLALGDRRARAAKDFLVRYGIEAARIETISYGRERPFAMGSDEVSWQQNRRAHVVVKK